MEKRISMLLSMMFLCVGMAMAQITVKGTIIAADDGEPLPGASVKVVGMKTGTATDVNGQFTITVPSSESRLEISHIGMITRVVRARNGMQIALDIDEKLLDELMVVAYGTQTKAQFTGSASVMKAEDLEKFQVTNAIDALKGRASGVQIYNVSGQPGGASTVRIRGINSLSATNSPLYVLDGAPFDGDINMINPNDIESLTVLKDAASTALYGARGGNGVILVTTKSAKKGKDATVTMDAKWGVNQKGTPQYRKIDDPAAYYEMWYKGLYNYASNSTDLDGLGLGQNAAWQWANEVMFDPSSVGNESLGYNVYNVPAGQWLIGRNGRLNSAATLGRVVTNNGQQYLLTPDDWEKETYGNGLRQDYTVTASGANDRSSFYLSANYLNNEGITEASSYERFSTRMKADYQLKSWLRVGANMSYNHYEQNSLSDEGNNGVGNAFAYLNAAPIYPMYVRDAQGNIIYDNTAKINVYDFGDGKVTGVQRAFLPTGNPVAGNILDTNEIEGNNFAGVGTVDVRLPYGLAFTSINSVYVDEARSTAVTNPYYGQYANSKGIVNKEHQRTWTQNYQQRLDWKKVFGKHDVEAMFGHESYDYRSYDLYYYKTNMFSQENKELAGAIIGGTGNSSRSRYNTEQWLGRALYNFDTRYFVEGSVVRQASSRFHKNHRWGTFWSASAGWLINREAFMKKYGWIDELKLKASYGENGNDGISGWLYTNRYTITNSNDEISLVPSTTMGNENITWETNAKFNVGVDFSFWHGRLGGGIEFYQNKTSDMLYTFTLPVSFGYTNYYTNIGDMVNRGVEIELSGDVVRTRNLKWSLYANITSNHNEVTKLPEERQTKRVWTSDGELYDGYASGSYFFAEGLSAYGYYTHKFAGLDENGRSLWYKNVYETDEEGADILDERGFKTLKDITTTTKYDEADDYVVGDIMPDFYGGFGTSLNAYGVDFSVDFTYQLGGKVYDSTYASLMGLNSTGQALHKDLYNAWTESGTGSDIPRMQYGDTHMNGASDRFLTSAKYLSLQNITLGYTLPQRWTRKFNVERIRLYGVADNIWVWSARRGLDPRMALAGSISNSYYSAMRTISGGINITF